MHARRCAFVEGCGTHTCILALRVCAHQVDVLSYMCPLARGAVPKDVDAAKLMVTD